MTLDEAVDRLRAGEPLLVDESTAEQLRDLAIPQDLEGRFVWPEALVPLRDARIRSSFSTVAERWLKRLEIHGAIDSTNERLQALAREGDLSGLLVTSECQTAGRGRQGRRWHSPLGASIAMSFGFSLRRPAAELEGLSLVVGLALVEMLDSDGQLGVRIKWPNDVHSVRGKLSGILIELAPSTRPGSQVIIGVGVNFRNAPGLGEVVGQPVDDLETLYGRLATGAVDRSAVIGRFASTLVDFVSRFDDHGFQPFRAAFQAVHSLHDQPCRLLRGEQEVLGQVLGVDDRGRLRFLADDGDGREEAIASGELSLRPR